MEPIDKKLYERIKKKYQQTMPNSAYRSGLIVKEYKRAFKKKYNKDKAYYGSKTNKKGLGRWFAEEWRNESGKVGYNKKNTLYRPTKVITKETPTTWSELSKKQISTAKKKKKQYGRVDKFD
ncbi:hypothetical protein QJ857_gp0278 [Tupanvirus soda lake]|uniref:DUF5872 domain-containing protein n=2 Tax=Tupanvirus TaxID=2094720 RepID=A0A6N1NTN0_9VIRU|nr:hypothetical protein QJ857_gp0278 [Tupanvirus soda lake]QKU35747.1 hypothetical protein [Tupanvirus soda lake]